MSTLIFSMEMWKLTHSSKFGLKCVLGIRTEKFVLVCTLKYIFGKHTYICLVYTSKCVLGVHTEMYVWYTYCNVCLVYILKYMFGIHTVLCAWCAL